jgi:hypothetical protein
MEEVKIDACFFCGEPSTGVYCMAYAPISMQMCDKCSSLSLVSTHNIFVRFVNAKGDIEAVKKSFRHCPEALVYWEGEYLKPNDFCDKINLEVLDKFYSNMNTHFTYLEARNILLNKKEV